MLLTQIAGTRGFAHQEEYLLLSRFDSLYWGLFFWLNALHRRYPYCILIVRVPSGFFALTALRVELFFDQELKKGTQEKQILSTSLSLSPQITVPQQRMLNQSSALEIDTVGILLLSSFQRKVPSTVGWRIHMLRLQPSFSQFCGCAVVSGTW